MRALSATLLVFGVLVISPSSCSDSKQTEESAKAAGPDDIERHLGLVNAPGREHVIANCLPCHSGAIIVANHLSRDGWEGVIDQMQKKNGMKAIAPQVRKSILDYLEANQRPADAGLAAGKKSPWAAPLYRPNPIWK